MLTKLLSKTTFKVAAFGLGFVAYNNKYLKQKWISSQTASCFTLPPPQHIHADNYKDDPYKRSRKCEPVIGDDFTVIGGTSNPDLV